jgi:hypothetical protein
MEAYKKEQMKQEIEDAITDDSGQIELDTITDVLFTLVKKMVQLELYILGLGLATLLLGLWFIASILFL